MTTKTRPSLPKGKPNNGISRWDNEGGAPSSGDRSRKQGGRTPKNLTSLLRRRPDLAGNPTRISDLLIEHRNSTPLVGMLLGETPTFPWLFR